MKDIEKDIDPAELSRSVSHLCAQTMIVCEYYGLDIEVVMSMVKDFIEKERAFLKERIDNLSPETLEKMATAPFIPPSA